MKNHSSRNLGLILMGIGLLLVGFGVYGLVSPDEFRASARIVLPRSDSPEIVDGGETGSKFNSNFADFVKKERENIRSKTILSNVLVQLDLTSESASFTNSRQKPHMNQAIARLRKRTEVRQIPNTRLIEVSFIDESPVQAAKYANAIVTTYKAWDSDAKLQITFGGIVELEKQLEAQNQKARFAETELSRLKETLRTDSPETPALESGTNNPTLEKARKTLEDEINFQSLLKRKINTEKIDLSFSGSSFIEIIEYAAPPVAPSRQKRARGSLLIIVGLICCGWGFSQARNSKSADEWA